MFLITRNVAWIPMAIIIWLGTPFKWKDGSTLKNFSDENITAQFDRAKTEHYSERILAIVVAVFLVVAWFFVSWLTSGYNWYIFPTVLVVVLFIDTVLAISRYFYFQEQEKIATETGTALVLMDVWKDSDLASLIKQAHDDRNAANEVKASGINQLKKANQD